jgi:hypothetical protein
MTLPSSSTDAHLRAAQSYLNLGMPQAAWEELEKIDKSEKVNLLAIWKVQVEVARALGKWQLVGELARQLAKLEPDEPRHLANLEQAMSRTAELRARP